MSQSHSEVPVNDEDWPVIEDVTEYRDRVRARLLRIYDEVETGKRRLTRRLVRVMQMAYEHEGFHVEVGLFCKLCETNNELIQINLDPPLHAHTAQPILYHQSPDYSTILIPNTSTRTPCTSTCCEPSPFYPFH